MGRAGGLAPLRFRRRCVQKGTAQHPTGFVFCGCELYPPEVAVPTV